MKHYTSIASQRLTFPEIEGPEGGPLVIEPGEGVDLAEDPGSPWLVEDPTTPEAVATATGIYEGDAEFDPDVPAGKAPRKRTAGKKAAPRKAAAKKRAARARDAEPQSDDAGDAGAEPPSE